MSLTPWALPKHPAMRGEPSVSSGGRADEGGSACLTLTLTNFAAACSPTRHPDRQQVGAAQSSGLQDRIPGISLQRASTPVSPASRARTDGELGRGSPDLSRGPERVADTLEPMPAGAADFRVRVSGVLAAMGADLRARVCDDRNDEDRWPKARSRRCAL